jgi:hypothetical protein
MNDKPDFNYIGQCPQCSAYCVVVVDDPDDAKFTGQTVANMIKDGLMVTRVDNDFVRANFGHCDCKSKPKKKSAQMELGI